ncbi:MAG: histidine phosphatase family protein, partial [Pirellulales bacterium]
MSVLTIVRHGQASLFAADYDRLSDVGEQQGRALGTWWADQRLVIDRVYCGPRVRHRHSAELTGESYRLGGLRWPEPIVLEELDEFDMDGLIHRFAPGLAERDSNFARLAEAFLQSEHNPDRPLRFQRMFETLLRAWQVSDSSDCDVENWPAFQQRVWGVMRRIQQQPQRGTRTVVFSSGGV